MNSSQYQKNKLRKKIISQRNGMKRAEITQKSTQIIKNLLNNDEISRLKAILMYIPINNEVDTKSLFERLTVDGKNIYLPAFLVKDKRWVISEFESINSLVKGPFNTLQPKGVKEIPVFDIDVAIIPAVAFSKDLVRLGYGQGVYDKILGNFKGLKVGLAYDFQNVEKINFEPHDIKMDLVVCESGIFTNSE